MMTLDTSAMVTSGKIPLLMEEAGNWVTWKAHIEAKLSSINAKDITLGKEICPPPHTLDPSCQTAAENQVANALVLEEQYEWDKCNAKAYNLIVENIDDSHLSLFEDPPVNPSSHLAYE